MTPTAVFSIVNLMAMPMWILMIVLPNWKITRFLIDYKVIPILLAIVYGFYISIALNQGGGMDFGSLAAVKQLFTQDNAVLAGWVHYLAFDLLVGMWILDQNKNLGIHQLLIAPCLLGAFLLGPIGFLLFMVIKSLQPKAS